MRWLALTTLVIGISTVRPASAQPPVGADGQGSQKVGPSVKRMPTGGSLGMGFAPTPIPRLVFINNQGVQKELNLKPEQRAKVANILTDLQEQGVAHRKRFTPTRDQAQSAPLDPAEIRAQSQAMMAAREELDRAAEEALRKALNPKQRTRFEEIRLQAEGPFAFLDPETHQMLNLAPEQVAAISDILVESRGMVISAMRSPLGPRAGAAQPATKKFHPADPKNAADMSKRRGDAILKTRGKIMHEISRVLSKGQRAKYQKMLGEPFDLAKLSGGL